MEDAPDGRCPHTAVLARLVAMDAMRELTTISSGDQMVLTGLALLDATEPVSR